MQATSQCGPVRERGSRARHVTARPSRGHHAAKRLLLEPENQSAGKWLQKVSKKSLFKKTSRLGVVHSSNISPWRRAFVNLPGEAFGFDGF